MGELKHGSLSLIGPGMPCVLLATRRETLGRALAASEEIRSRKGYVILIVPEDAEVGAEVADEIVRLPAAEGLAQAVAAAICLQLIAYRCALKLGRQIDQPRNLAKSVTVI